MIFYFNTMGSIAIAIKIAYLIRHAELLRPCLTLYSPVDCSLPGSSGYVIFQTRVLEWVAISYSKGQILTLTNKYVVQCSLGYYVLCPHYTEPRKHWGSVLSDRRSRISCLFFTLNRMWQHASGI